jgi:hypothetical protein
MNERPADPPPRPPMNRRTRALLERVRVLLEGALAKTHRVALLPNAPALRTHEIGMPAGEGIRQFEPRRGESVAEFAERIVRALQGPG